MPPNQRQNLSNGADMMNHVESDLEFVPISLSILDNAAEFSLRTAASNRNEDKSSIFRCAILGCGMMGQEHISYIMGYMEDIRIDFLCDPHRPSLEKSLKMMEKQFQMNKTNITTIEDKKLSCENMNLPVLLTDEHGLLQHAHNIDLLVIATPNYLHTDSLIKWAKYDLTILVEKPVAVSYEQHQRLKEQLLNNNGNNKARIWVAMEYRYIPAIAKLLSLLPTIGDVKMITIRENRYPFLQKIGKWNRDKFKTGDTLVEKCCHFFDLFRLISNQEFDLNKIRAIAQRGLNYQDEPEYQHIMSPDCYTPIIDSAYVVMPFENKGNSRSSNNDKKKNANIEVGTMGCLELCMYAEGSRHQEEIIVTGTKGRLEAYLPENKVYSFERPSRELWSDRSVPPPVSSIREEVHDCCSIHNIHGISSEVSIPTHDGYHYSSTGIEWYRLLTAMKNYHNRDDKNSDGNSNGASNNVFVPEVSLEDGLRAVEIGLQATSAIVNEGFNNSRN